MFEDFEDVFKFNVFEGFDILFLTLGKAKLFLQGDFLASDVQEELERNGIHSDCYQMHDGVIVAIAGADEPRARWLLENWR